jgi:hypothetical protein
MKNKKVNIKEPKTFNEIFLPLELYGAGKVFANGHMAFDFALKWLYPDCVEISEDKQQLIVDILNGKTESDLNLSLSYSNGIIYAQEREFIIIRGWGHLTGGGGLGLSQEVAALIQDQFALYIINKITKQ